MKNIPCILFISVKKIKNKVYFSIVLVCLIKTLEIKVCGIIQGPQIIQGVVQVSMVLNVPVWCHSDHVIIKIYFLSHQWIKRQQKTNQPVFLLCLNDLVCQIRSRGVCPAPSWFRRGSDVLFSFFFQSLNSTRCPFGPCNHCIMHILHVSHTWLVKSLNLWTSSRGVTHWGIPPAPGRVLIIKLWFFFFLILLLDLLMSFPLTPGFSV